MATKDEVEGFITRLETEGIHAREIGKGLWVLSSAPDSPELVLHYNPPVLVLRVKVLELGPGNSKADLYKHLLTLNATDLIHGSYGIDGDNVVLTDPGPTLATFITTPRLSFIDGVRAPLSSVQSTVRILNFLIASAFETALLASSTASWISAITSGSWAASARQSAIAEATSAGCPTVGVGRRACPTTAPLSSTTTA